MAKKIVFLSLVLVAGFWTGTALGGAVNLPQTGQTTRNSELLQFTSGGHVLGFKPEGVYVASGDHLLKVTFQNGRKVTPITETGQSSDKKAQPLTKVSYPDLWKGISLTYDGIKEGILRSTYAIQPWAKVKDIKLQYNAPLEIDRKGTLRLKYPYGEMTESAPIAWQEIDGKRVSVKVAFRKLGEKKVGFDVGNYNDSYPLIIDPTLEWNTFLGSSSNDFGGGLAVDTSGSVYISGRSDASWGSPIRPYSGGNDVFVAKLSSSGILQWNTFLGSSAFDAGYGLGVDSSGSVYISGRSDASWGSPIRPYSGGNDAFVAKLNSNGVLQWNTFLGSSGIDEGSALAVDTSGNIYITGVSYATWGSPIRPFSGSDDAFVAKLDSSGVLQWNTFLGSGEADWGSGLAVTTSGNVYVTGGSYVSWGSPIRPHAGWHFGPSGDAFVAKLITDGNSFSGRLYLPIILKNSFTPSNNQTTPPTHITPTSAEFGGTLFPITTMTYYFQWGLSPSYGYTTPVQTIGPSSIPINVYYYIVQLTPGTTYYYRLVYYYGGSYYYGSPQTFTTSGYIPHNPFQIDCESSEYTYGQCPSSVGIDSVRVASQLSTADCVQGDSWGFTHDYIWIDKGCRAIFDVNYAYAFQIDCESSEYQYGQCGSSVPIYSLWLGSQVSTAACIQNQTYGFTSSYVWVDQGCRGIFNIN